MKDLEERIGNKLLGTKRGKDSGSITLPDGSTIELPVDGNSIACMAVFPDLKYGGGDKLVIGTTSCCSGYLFEYAMSKDENGRYARLDKPMAIYHAPTNVEDVMPVVLETANDDTVTRMGYLIIGAGCHGSGAYLMGEKGDFEQLANGQEIGSSSNAILSAKGGTVYNSAAPILYPEEMSDEVLQERPKEGTYSCGKVQVEYASHLTYNSEKAASAAPVNKVLVSDLTDRLKGKVKLGETESLQARVDKYRHKWHTRWEEAYCSF